jgi:hypothetical protein
MAGGLSERRVRFQTCRWRLSWDLWSVGEADSSRLGVGELELWRVHARSVPFLHPARVRVQSSANINSNINLLILQLHNPANLRVYRHGM